VPLLAQYHRLSRLPFKCRWPTPPSTPSVDPARLGGTPRGLLGHRLWRCSAGAYGFLGDDDFADSPMASVATIYEGFFVFSDCRVLGLVPGDWHTS